jgi:hypothetical protein
VVLVVEHESTRGARWLRRYRGRLALWVAIAEGALVLLGVIPGWIALLVAVGLVLFYAFVGRNLPTDSAKQLSWIAAVSQLFVALLPILVAVVTIAAVIALVILGVVALALLAFDRR